MMKYKDQRVKLMSEILYGIRTLKFHSWESYFYDRVNGMYSHVQSTK
jgi:ATP-binding cassette subfamily C (CFTR/MRP) protein 10